MTQLYKLAADFALVAQKLEELELDAETVRDTMDGYSADFDNKVIAIASLIRNIEATAEAIRNAEIEQAARRKQLESRAEWLRDYVISNMKAINRTEVDCALFAVKVRTNPASVVISDDCDLPPQYVSRKIVVSPDKKALKEALQSGESIEGVSLVYNNSLSIK